MRCMILADVLCSRERRLLGADSHKSYAGIREHPRRYTCRPSLLRRVIDKCIRKHSRTDTETLNEPHLVRSSSYT
jgi:hypothetical protein